MAYLTKYGQHFGTVPATAGNIYFVAPSASYTLAGPQGQRTYIASDGNDGLSPERALLTINRAWALVTASVGDVIALLPGTHTPTATITANVAGVRMLGVGATYEGKADLTSPHVILAGATGGNTGLADDLINVTANRVEIGYMELRPTMGYDAICFETTTGLVGFYLHHVKIDMETANVSTQTRGVNFSHRAARSGSGYDLFSQTASTIYATLEDILAVADGAQGPALELATVYATVRRAQFNLSAQGSTWAIPVRVASNVANTLLDDCVWLSAGTMSQAIDGTDSTINPVGNGRFHLQECAFTGALTAVNKPLDGFVLGGTSSLFGGAAIGRNVQIMTGTGPAAVILIT